MNIMEKSKLPEVMGPEIIEYLCPECGSTDVEEVHAAGTFSYIPDINYKQCNKCGHQWDHQ